MADAGGDILVLNTGSSSLKFALYPSTAHGGEPQARLRGNVQGIGHRPRLRVDGVADTKAERFRPGNADHDDVLEELLRWLDAEQGLSLTAAGHRVVHGGTHPDAAVSIDDDTLAWLKSLEPLAPTHQAHNLAPIEALRRRQPDLRQVACFDTAFHRTQPAVARHFALPREYTERGIVRYGFHGLSFEFIAQALPSFDADAAAGRVIVAHLGHGASLCALQAGRSIATTMGFTVLDGLPMAQRCGSLDPGVILYLLRECDLSVDDVETLLYRRSGLLGVSGISDDMRELLEADAPAAREAVDLFIYRAAREAGSLVAALGGLDALVFTAGVGEHAARVRAGICEALGWLGLRLDAQANEANGPRIGSRDSAASIWVIPTDEESVIAGHTRRLLG